MKIVITGGLGFVGLNLARRLVSEGHEPLLIDSLTPQIHGALPQMDIPAGISVERLDVRYIAQFPELIDGCDAIFHLAAETGTGQSMYQIQQYVSVNDLGTAALLEAISTCKRRPRRIILASSRSVYGEGAYIHPNRLDQLVYPRSRVAQCMRNEKWEHIGADGVALVATHTPETAPVMPGSIYAATKAAQELLITASASALGLTSIILRFQNVYGEGQSLRNPYTGIISIFFNRARQGLEIPVYEDGLESRDFVHVDDVVDALVRSLIVDVPNGSVINVGSGDATPVRTLADTLLSVAGISVPVQVTGQFRLGDIRHCFADIALMRDLLGLKPRIGLREGLERFVNWAKTQPVYEDRSERAAEELRIKGLTNEQ
jgi:dTDP-L-rhamnose 4-epimerase